MTVYLTTLQLYFIRCAIELKEAVVPFDEEILEDEQFEKDYGFSKEQLRDEIERLRIKLK